MGAAHPRRKLGFCMTVPITLRQGALRCDIRPDLGGCIAGLWFSDVPVLRSTPATQLASVRLSGSFPLIPYSNRMAFARFAWNGQSYDLSPNFEPEPHAIHGAGWRRPWQVQECSDTAAVLALDHCGNSDWPFAFAASQHLSLQDGCLSLQMEITNQSSVPAPVGLGWHPYFAKHGDSHLAFASQGRWDMGPDQLPRMRHPHKGLDQDCAALVVDHCFDGWSGEALLRNARFAIRIGSDLPCLVACSNPGRDTIAVEPVSHVNNALNLLAQGTATTEALGVHVLAPGASMAASMQMTVELLS